MKKLLVMLLPVLAFLGGAAGGAVLHQRNAPAVEESDDLPPAESQEAPEDENEMAWFRFPNQFFVPLMRDSDISGTMIVTLTIEMTKADEEAVYAQQHRLRDALLRALMIHANTGGFDGNFTADPQMGRLKTELVKVAKESSEGKITDVLIEDIARQTQ